jgi:hypothetical protein
MGAKSKRTTAETAGQDDAVKSFIDDLQAEPSGHHVLQGMVKPADTSDGLMFALQGDCEHWIYLPAAGIQTIRRTGRTACKGHSHVTAEIELKPPQTDLEKTFADVASLHQSDLLRLHGNLLASAQLNAACPLGTSWKQDQWGNWGCWP